MFQTHVPLLNFPNISAHSLAVAASRLATMFRSHSITESVGWTNFQRSVLLLPMVVSNVTWRKKMQFGIVILHIYIYVYLRQTNHSFRYCNDTSHTPTPIYPSNFFMAKLSFIISSKNNSHQATAQNVEVISWKNWSRVRWEGLNSSRKWIIVCKEGFTFSFKYIHMYVYYMLTRTRCEEIFF